jgi:hypothetical protein
MKWLNLICGLVLLFPTFPALALDAPPDNLSSPVTVNLETPFVTPHQTVALQAGLRFIEPPESIAFSSLTLRYGISTNLEAVLRGSTGATRDTQVTTGGVISHGGSDLELFAKYALTPSDRTGLAVLVGVSFPSTPAQNQAVATIGASGSFRINNRTTLFLNPRATLQDNNKTVGIGIGAETHLTGKLSLVGDWTGIASGMNTRDTANGNKIRRDIWGAALRWTAVSNTSVVSLDLGYGNGTGSTIGFGLTPGLANSAGFYIALAVRR